MSAGREAFFVPAGCVMVFEKYLISVCPFFFQPSSCGKESDREISKKLLNSEIYRVFQHMLLSDAVGIAAVAAIFCGSGGRLLHEMRINEYTDLKNVRHTVSHMILSTADRALTAQILEEIKEILKKQKEKLSEKST